MPFDFSMIKLCQAHNVLLFSPRPIFLNSEIIKNFVANAFMMHKPVFAGFGLTCSKLKIISHSKASENMDLAFLLVQKDFFCS